MNILFLYDTVHKNVIDVLLVLDLNDPYKIVFVWVKVVCIPLISLNLIMVKKFICQFLVT